MKAKEFYEYCRDLDRQLEEYQMQLKEIAILKASRYDYTPHTNYYYSNIEKAVMKKERLREKCANLMQQKKEIERTLFQYFIEGGTAGYLIVNSRLKNMPCHLEKTLKKRELEKIEQECIDYICLKLHYKPQERRKEAR